MNVRYLIPILTIAIFLGAFLTSAPAQDVFKIKAKTEDGKKYRGYYQAHNKDVLRLSKKKLGPTSHEIYFEDIAQLKIKRKIKGLGFLKALGGGFAGGLGGAYLASLSTTGDEIQDGIKSLSGMFIGATIGAVTATSIHKFNALLATSETLDHYFQKFKAPSEHEYFGIVPSSSEQEL